MLLYLDPDETIDVVLDVDEGNPRPTVFECTLVSAARHARMMALVETRRAAHLDVGGKRFDPDLAEKTKETEVRFIASMVKRIRDIPLRDGTRKTFGPSDREQIVDTLLNRIPMLAYDDLLNKLLSLQGISNLEGMKSPASSAGGEDDGGGEIDSAGSEPLGLPDLPGDGVGSEEGLHAPKEDDPDPSPGTDES